MKTPSRFLPLLLLLLVLPCFVSAQSTPAAPNPAEDKVTVQFGIYAWKGDLPPLCYGPRRTVEEVEAHTRSSVQTYTGPALLNFTLVPQTAEPKPGSPPPPVVASVSLPRGVSRVTLLTARVRPDRYQIYTIPEDGDEFPSGSVRLHNVTPQRLMIVYNDNQRLELAPGAISLVKPIGDAMLIRVARFVNGRWRELFNNVATLNPDGRQNVLFIPGDQGSTGVSMYSLPPWSAPLPVVAHTAGF
jgi:hypothetical protein